MSICIYPDHKIENIQRLEAIDQYWNKNSVLVKQFGKADIHGSSETEIANVQLNSLFGEKLKHIERDVDVRIGAEKYDGMAPEKVPEVRRIKRGIDELSNTLKYNKMNFIYMMTQVPSMVH